MVGRGPRRGAECGAAWPLRPSATDGDWTDRGAGPAGRRWFTSLLLAYTLEDLGYIIAGTFLVAVIDQTASTTLGSSAWIIVGMAASLAALMLRHRFPHHLGPVPSRVRATQ